MYDISVINLITDYIPLTATAIKRRHETRLTEVVTYVDNPTPILKYITKSSLKSYIKEVLISNPAFDRYYVMYPGNVTLKLNFNQQLAFDLTKTGIVTDSPAVAGYFTVANVEDELLIEIKSYQQKNKDIITIAPDPAWTDVYLSGMRLIPATPVDTQLTNPLFHYLSLTADDQNNTLMQFNKLILSADDLAQLGLTSVLQLQEIYVVKNDCGSYKTLDNAVVDVIQYTAIANGCLYYKVVDKMILADLVETEVLQAFTPVLLSISSDELIGMMTDDKVNGLTSQSLDKARSDIDNAGQYLKKIWDLIINQWNQFKNQLNNWFSGLQERLKYSWSKAMSANFIRNILIVCSAMAVLALINYGFNGFARLFSKT